MISGAIELASPGNKDRPETRRAFAAKCASYLARGIGNYYKPAMFGGGPDLAIRDIRRAIELDPKSAEAFLWLGLALRKTHHNAEARKAFTKSLELNPNRIWTRQQLDKTPAS